jgi:cupin fold WbuC family metalloprotein
MDANGIVARRFEETSPGVFYAPGEFVVADGETVAFLKDAALRSPLRRARLCAHPDPGAAQHDMLIVSAAGTYVAPHRHPTKTESFVVLEGEADCLLFEEDGRLARVLPMGPAGSGKAFFYRMPPHLYHSLEIRTDVLVFAESTLGPFGPGAMETAPWAPGPKETEAGRAFLAAAVARHRGAVSGR